MFNEVDSIDFQKPVYYLLLVNNTNLRPILHRFQVIAEVLTKETCFKAFFWGEPLNSRT